MKPPSHSSASEQQASNFTNSSMNNEAGDVATEIQEDIAMAQENVVEPFPLLKRGGRRLSGCTELLDDVTASAGSSNIVHEHLGDVIAEASSDAVTGTVQEQDQTEWLRNHYYGKFIEEFKKSGEPLALPPKWFIRKTSNGVYAQFFDDIDESIQTSIVAAKTV